jgi:GTPase SAR1 family protein
MITLERLRQGMVTMGILESYKEWRRARTRDRSCSVLMIGPSNSGKTTFLSALTLAAAQANQDRFNGHGRGKRILRPQSEAMIRLHEAAALAIGEGRLPGKATEDVTAYQFNFEAEYPTALSKVFFGHSQILDFSMIDTPGGALLPNEMSGIDPMRHEVAQVGKNAEAVVLCIDSTDNKTASIFLQFMPRMLQLFADNEFQHRRIIILLTKADEYFRKYEYNAHKMAKEKSPWPRALELLTPLGGKQLLDSAASSRVQFLCGWVSAYGFLPDGRPNFDPEHHRMIGLPELEGPARYIQSWRPFQVLDPLVFLSLPHDSGELWWYPKK